MILNAIQNDGKIWEIEEDTTYNFLNLGDFKWPNANSSWYSTGINKDNILLNGCRMKMETHMIDSELL